MLEPGIGLAQDERRVGLHDARLLRRDLGAGRPEVVHMVDRDVGDHGHAGLERVGRVPRAAESDLHDGDVDREVREPRVRRRGQHLEVRRMQVECVLDDRDGAQQVVELVVGDGHPLIRDAFVDVFQMRARVRTDGEADRAEQLASPCARSTSSRSFR